MILHKNILFFPDSSSIEELRNTVPCLLEQVDDYQEHSLWRTCAFCCMSWNSGRMELPYHADNCLGVKLLAALCNDSLEECQKHLKNSRVKLSAQESTVK